MGKPDWSIFAQSLPFYDKVKTSQTAVASFLNASLKSHIFGRKRKIVRGENSLKTCQKLFRHRILAPLISFTFASESSNTVWRDDVQQKKCILNIMPPCAFSPRSFESNKKLISIVIFTTQRRLLKMGKDISITLHSIPMDGHKFLTE